NLALAQDEVVAVGLRYFNVYGEREFFKGKTASMILQFGLQLLRGENPKLFEGSEKIKRDFIYVQDVIQANLLACKAKKSGVYNVGTGKARSFKEIVDILCQELNLSPVYEYIPNPYTKQYQYFTQADISSTIKELGYQPKYSLEEGIKATLPYIKKIFEEEF
ncbi:MAG: NAD-dependent epimerase/dehydratase family protein, partial [Epsilonproteobacteria bacterium]|nr:NAD-dependent epimerase/dehydratase family protein [Campylobacterota bacterium]